MGQGKERVPRHLEPTWLLHHLPFPMKARERLERLQDLGELGPGLGWRARVRRQQGTAAIRQPLAQAQGLHGHLLLHLVQKTACIGGDITPFSDEKAGSKRGKARPLSPERHPSHEWNPGLSHQCPYSLHDLASKEGMAPRPAELSRVLLLGTCESGASVSTSCPVQVSGELRWEQQPPSRRRR